MAQVGQDSDEEEAIILVELNQLPNPDILGKCRGTCSILGIDTPEPILQLDNFVFKGKLEETLGSALFFRQDTDGKRLSYVCKTTKKLTMSRVILKRRDNATDKEGSREELKEAVGSRRGEEERDKDAMDTTEASTAGTSS